MASSLGTVKRVLGVVRLSDDTDATTSPERQRAIIENWARANGHVIAGWAEDLDVSGKVSPFDRSGLGPWLKRPERFDVIACWKLDRLSRSVIHFARLMEWCDNREQSGGKTIVSVTEGVDMSTPMGRLFAHIIAAFAQGELETMTERVTASHARLRQDGRYAGAPLPFGYVTAPRADGKGLTLVQEPEYAALLRRLVKDVTEGVSTHELARRLNAEGVRTWGWKRAQMAGLVLRTSDKKVDLAKQRWSADVIQQVLKSPSCCGQKVQKVKTENGRYLRTPVPVRDEDDQPVMATAEPIVSPEQWRAAVAAMSSRARPGERSARTDSLLQGVIVCACCKTNLFVHRMTKTVRGEQKVYSYYRCQADRKGGECAHPAALPMDAAEAEVTEQVLSLLHGKEITRTEYDPGEDYAAQINEARGRLDELEDDYLQGVYDGPEAKRRYERLHRRTSERIDALEALPRRTAAVRTVGTGETYDQRWEASTRLERRAFLIEQGFSVLAAAPGVKCGTYCNPDDCTVPHVRTVFPESTWTMEASADGSLITYTSGVPTGARLGSA